MATAKVSSISKHPYFIWWDQDVTEQDLREALIGDNLYRRITVMSYIVNDAEPDDVWKYLTVQDIQKNFWQIRWRSAQLRGQWQSELISKDYPPGECADPIAARVLA